MAKHTLDLVLTSEQMSYDMEVTRVIWTLMGKNRQNTASGDKLGKCVCVKLSVLVMTYMSIE